MDLKDKNKWGLKRLFRSFFLAWSGLLFVLKNEQNFRIHLASGLFVIIFALVLDVPVTHLLILILVIGIVLALEVMNTAIERTVDLITAEYHPLAKLAKDIAAGAVFIFVFIAVIIGFLVFLPLLIPFMGTLIFIIQL